MKLYLTAPLLLALFSANAWADAAPITDSMGKDPKLPKPESSWLPTVNIAPAKGWTGTGTPKAGEGLKVAALAEGLDHPRWVYVLPNGDVLVAETNAPERPDHGNSIRGYVQGVVMKRAGAATPTANRITLLRDADGDGVAEGKFPFITGLNSPFGMALVGDNLYVANTDAVVRFPYKEGQTQITQAPVKLSDLPGGTLNHHWTKSLIASRDGTKLYAGVGSNSNVGENGMDKEDKRAAVWEIDLATGANRVFASGLRNPVGLSIEPQTGALWAAVNERDEIGPDLVPDYMTSVKDGGFYGWPYSYYGANVDERIQPARPDLVAKAIKPDYALGAHTASLGLTFAEGAKLPERFRNGAFVGQHGSWNRTPPSGYKVIFVPFENGQPSGPALDVLTGFLDADKNALGRPVGVAIDKSGALLVADDVGNKIWRVQSSEPQRDAAAQ
ncbi:MAG: sorbosone dehydrogenase family protein [Hyphomicrobiales bacterium]|nr:sorbosone dehydrogenase family protein [Hyphomicrobiales bacterium]